MSEGRKTDQWLFVEPSKRVPLAKVYFDEQEPAAAARVVKSGWLCQGPLVEEFEAQFARKFKVKHAVAVSSGSVALYVALAAMGVKAGDEVIVPDMTFISTATAAMLLGARPVFCDIELASYNMDPGRLAGLVTDRTRVILPVHYAGQTADMDPILDIARRRGLLVLEDAAEAHAARYKGGRCAGTIGDAGIFSFTPTKLMTTGEGGMIVTDSDEIAGRCRLIRNFGDAGKFDWRVLGFNFRLTETAAAVGLCQLAKLDEIFGKRHERSRRYNECLAGEEGLLLPSARCPEDINYQLYTVRLDPCFFRRTRDEIMAGLAERGVSTRLYYPALHHQRVFEGLGRRQHGDFPKACLFQETALSLPIYASLSTEEQDYVIEALLKIAGESRR